jgi:hypothetical protein
VLRMILQTKEEKVSHSGTPPEPLRLAAGEWKLVRRQIIFQFPTAAKVWFWETSNSAPLMRMKYRDGGAGRGRGGCVLDNRSQSILCWPRLHEG